VTDASTAQRQRSAGHDADQGVSLVPTSWSRPSGRCGQHVHSPHPTCEAPVRPYVVAERFVERNTVFVVCRPCGATWREVAA
jgi:hypothetical protein